LRATDADLVGEQGVAIAMPMHQANEWLVAKSSMVEH
jgi:hypothetical protein